MNVKYITLYLLANAITARLIPAHNVWSVNTVVNSLGAFVCVQCDVSIRFDTIAEAVEIADDHTLVCNKPYQFKGDK